LVMTPLAAIICSTCAFVLAHFTSTPAVSKVRAECSVRAQHPMQLWGCQGQTHRPQMQQCDWPSRP
jgi:hypothetical protein